MPGRAQKVSNQNLVLTLSTYGGRAAYSPNYLDRIPPSSHPVLRFSLLREQSPLLQPKAVMQPFRHYSTRRLSAI